MDEGRGTERMPVGGIAVYGKAARTGFVRGRIVICVPTAIRVTL
jgi:hypothetical protein